MTNIADAKNICKKINLCLMFNRACTIINFETKLKGSVNVDSVDSLSILNYQGSKRNLLPFIKNNSESAISSGQTVLDIFAGTCSVGYSFKRTNRIFANDCEKYAYIISQALLGRYSDIVVGDVVDNISLAFEKDIEQTKQTYGSFSNEEMAVLRKGALPEITKFYHSVPTVWNGMADEFVKPQHLFLRYYSSS